MNVDGIFGVRQRLELIGALNGIRRALTESTDAGLARIDQEIQAMCVVPEARSTSTERMRAMRARLAEAQGKAKRGRPRKS